MQTAFDLKQAEVDYKSHLDDCMADIITDAEDDARQHLFELTEAVTDLVRVVKERFGNSHHQAKLLDMVYSFRRTIEDGVESIDRMIDG